MDRNLKEEKLADYQCYEVSGDPYSIGRMTAEKLREPIYPGAGLTEGQRELAARCRDQVREVFPEMIEELTGYSDALRLNEDELLWHYAPGIVGGCSAIAVLTGDGILVARNYDYFYWENIRHLIRTRPSYGYAHVGMHEGLAGGRFDGMNERGLFVSFNGAGPFRREARPASPST